MSRQLPSAEPMVAIHVEVLEQRKRVLPLAPAKTSMKYRRVVRDELEPWSRGVERWKMGVAW